MGSPTDSKTDSGRRRDPIAEVAEKGGRILDLGMRAYLWGYPAVITARTRDYATDPLRDDSFPQNTFSHSTELYDHRNRIIVKPNNDTLYSWAWVDLSRGPVTLTVPPVSRYHSFQLMDAYTNTWAYVGSRTTGSDGGTYVMVGPDAEHTGTDGATVLRSPTDHVWLFGRTLVDGPDDLATAGEIIRGYTLRGPEIPAPRRTAPAPSPHTLPEAGLEFFDELSRVLASDPPSEHDQGLLDELAAVGVAAGREPSVEITDPVVRGALGAAVGTAHRWLASYGRALSAPGWSYSTKLGDYGRNYLLRASVALRGLGALTADEAIYPTTRYDKDGERLDGRQTYLLRFGPGELPPVGDVLGFWSLTMYDEDNFLVENPINRYSIGDRTPDIVYGDDGSLEIVVSRERPEPGVNWFPAPAGPFEITMRCYLPTGTLLDGEYVVPALCKL